jgi:hypothetical protein
MPALELEVQCGTIRSCANAVFRSDKFIYEKGSANRLQSTPRANQFGNGAFLFERYFKFWPSFEARINSECPVAPSQLEEQFAVFRPLLLREHHALAYILLNASKSCKTQFIRPPTKTSDRIQECKCLVNVPDGDKVTANFPPVTNSRFVKQILPIVNLGRTLDSDEAHPRFRLENLPLKTAENALQWEQNCAPSLREKPP